MNINTGIYIGSFAHESNKNKCNPFITNNNKFSIKIDNQIYPQSKRLIETVNLTCLNNNIKTTKTKTILLWNPFFSSNDYYFGLGKITPFVQNNCPITNCELTNDKNRLKESDYVITHMRNSFQRPNDINRSLNQRWIFFLAESPMHSASFKQYNNFYNLTATYRLDSNFNGFYEANSVMEWQLNEEFNVNQDFSANKIGFAAAIISNCNDNSNRLDYIRKLRKHISVDLFGKCGRPCPNKYKQTNPGPQGDCKEIIAKEYKFYLAFENSVCTDYITEKFFAILKFNIIPVVLGGGRYDYYVSLIYYNRFINL